MSLWHEYGGAQQIFGETLKRNMRISSDLSQLKSLAPHINVGPNFLAAKVLRKKSPSKQSDNQVTVDCRSQPIAV